MICSVPRRGSVAFVTVIALVPLIGVGRARGRGRIVVRHPQQHAQNAADAAAYSGALQLSCNIAGATCAVQQSDYRGKRIRGTERVLQLKSGDTAYPGTICATSHRARVSRAVQIDIGDYNAGYVPQRQPAGIGNAVRARGQPATAGLPGGSAGVDDHQHPRPSRCAGPAADQGVRLGAWT